MIIKQIARKVLRTILILGTTFCGTLIGFAQEKGPQDSLALVNEQNARAEAILKADSLRRMDSIKQLNLLDELAKLKTTDNLKKAELLAEIELLKNANQQYIAEQRKQIDSLRAISTGYPVNILRDTLFNIYTKLGPFSPEKRAKNTIEQLNQLIEERNFVADSLRLFPNDDSVDLLYNDKILLTVTRLDALWADMEPNELANKYRDSIANHIQKRLEETKLSVILINILTASAILLILFFIIKLVNRLYRKVRISLMRNRTNWFNGFKIKNYELFSANRQAQLVVILANILKWVIIFIIVYLALLLLFGIFPWTEPIADKLLNYALGPIEKIAISIWNYLPNLFTVFIIIFFFYYVFKALAYFKEEVASGALTIPGFYADWANPTYHVIRILLVAFMIIIIYPYLPGSDSPVFKGVSVFLGVLLTFGSSSSLSNIISGLVLTYTRAFKLGDRVRIGESVGDIIEKNLLVTRIRTINNEDITIPNSAVMNSHTINYSAEAEENGLCISTQVRVNYDVPWRQVHELLIKAAENTTGILKDPKPYVLQKSLDTYFVVYELNAFTRLANKQAGLLSQMHEHIQDEFKSAGISLVNPFMFRDFNP